jgi:hypothetical protein
MGKLERFDGIGRNEMTKSIPCRMVIDDPVTITPDGRKHVLVRGMYVKCRIVLPGRGSKLAAVATEGIRPGDRVWVVRDRRLHEIDVNVIDRTPCSSETPAKMVVVELDGTGLMPGDQVVTGPLPQPVEEGTVLLREDLPTSVADGESERSPDSPRREISIQAKDGTSRNRVPGQASRTSHQDRS